MTTPAEKFDVLSEIVEALCKQVEGMTTSQKEELRAELLYEYYDAQTSPCWLN